uniref:Ovule protein n=1 Tax=Syphacia muris TaxID=451379 RepID=A0A0N5ADY6_9BILA
MELFEAISALTNARFRDSLNGIESWNIKLILEQKSCGKKVEEGSKDGWMDGWMDGSRKNKDDRRHSWIAFFRSAAASAAVAAAAAKH